MAHDPPAPEYTFAFVVKESFALSTGLTVISHADCKWVPSLRMKVLLRTPCGKLLESEASLLITHPNSDHIISLQLNDVAKSDVPDGTEIFVRMRRTPKEQQEAISLLDKTMGSSWTNIAKFHDFPDALDFQIWIKQQISNGLAEEVPIKKPHRQNKSGEIGTETHTLTKSGVIWKLYCLRNSASN